MRRCYVLLWVALISLLVAPPQTRAADCTWVYVAEVTACDELGNCLITRIFELYCPGGGGTIPDPPPGSDPPPKPPGGWVPGTTVPATHPNDSDEDGIADEPTDFINTNDPCAFNLDAGDGLGSNWGGPNTTYPNHTGIDIQGDNGDALFSLVFGEVVWSSWGKPGQGYMSPDCGKAVSIMRPSGGVVTYCHMDDVVVAEGEVLDVGDWVGALGNTGDSSGYHVHVSWEEPAGSRCNFLDWTGSQAGFSFNPGGC